MLNLARTDVIHGIVI